MKKKIQGDFRTKRLTTGKKKKKLSLHATIEGAKC